MFRRILVLSLALVFLARGVAGATLQDDLSANQAEQDRLRSLIADTQKRESTLANQISIFDNEIKLTQLQINAKQAELSSKEDELAQLGSSIANLSGKITDLGAQMNNLAKVSVNRFRIGLANSTAMPWGALILSDDLQGSFQSLAYQQYIAYKDHLVFADLLNLKSDLSSKKTQVEGKQAEVAKLRDEVKSDRDSLVAARYQLDRQKAAEARLLRDTQNSEAIYQQQLAQAIAQQKSLLAFANARVGSGGSILPHSGISDGWGNYYNQRDSLWGNVVIGNTSNPSYQVWQVGCLLTSVAMVFSHFDRSSTSNPGSIGADPTNYWGNTAALLIPGPVPPGHSESHYNDPSPSFLKGELAAGKVVIAGLSFNYGSIATGHWPDHWIVLRGVNSDGEFMVNDPWYQDAMNKPLNYSHPDLIYNDAMIIEARIYQ